MTKYPDEPNTQSENCQVSSVSESIFKVSEISKNIEKSSGINGQISKYISTKR